MVEMSELDSVRAWGIVGAGGGGFPTWRKLAARTDTIIVNGAECEPLMCKDKFLLRHRLDEVAKGLALAQRLTGAKRIIIAAKEKVELAGAESRILPDFYPAGDEHVLVQMVTGKRVPENGYPLEIGICVLNVETLCNLAQARPVTHKLLTVAGEVTHPGVYRVPVGMLLSELGQKAGAPNSGVAYICGGPMMGDVVDAAITPVFRITSALLILTTDHPVVRKKTEMLDLVARRARSNCIQCQFCTDLCPRALLGHGIKPHLAMRAFAYNLESDYNPRIGLASCSTCGVCEMSACPLDLSPRRVILELRKRGSESQKGVGSSHPLAAERQLPREKLIAKLDLRKYLISVPNKLIELTTKSVTIPLEAFGGEVPLSTVKVGDKVTAATTVAEPAGGRGVPVHASIAGTVKSVTTESIVIGE
jgi:Na+-translocating ferredoxin:NAD+ oxidoreductase RnfC subunit